MQENRETNRWLPAEAIQLLKDNVKYEEKLLPDFRGDLKKVEVPVRTKIGTYGMFNQYDLHRFYFKDDSFADEFVDAKALGGDHIIYFIGLKYNDVLYRWEKKQVRKENK